MKSYNIGICDDDIFMVNKIKEIIEQYFAKIENNVSIQAFESAEHFLESKVELDYLFLDVEMRGMSGIELKEQLQFSNHRFGIIFVTSYRQYQDEAFGRNVLAYINKDQLQRIHEVLRKIEKLDSSFPVIQIAGYTIKTNDLYYIKAEGGYVNMVTEARPYLCSGSLSSMLQRLNDKVFVQVHRSYIVNMSYVTRIGYDEIILSNQETLPLSRKYKDAFKEAYFAYVREK